MYKDLTLVLLDIKQAIENDYINQKRPICFFIRTELGYEGVDLFQELAQGWYNHSGVKEFPVEGVLVKDNLYVGKSKELRLELIEYILKIGRINYEPRNL